MVKLKAILIIDLLIVGAATGVYFYLQSQGVITGAAKPATFTYSDLTVDPLEAFVGESIQITVNVTNMGDVEGNTTVNLEINGAVKDTQNITLAGLKTSQIFEFTDIETKAGNYSVKIGDQIGSFLMKEAPPEASKIVLSNYKSDPYEVWPNQTITATADAFNPSAENSTLFITATDDGKVVGTQRIELGPGQGQKVVFNITASNEGKHNVKLNTLSGTYVVVKEGFHTLTIGRSGGGSKALPFTLNGEQHETTYMALVPVGEYTVVVPNPFDVGTGVLAFTTWSDGSTSASHTFKVESRTILVATYTLISGYACCPSLYFWNGTGYQYVTEVSNSGWLGYIGYINSAGTIVFKDGNPFDYVKLDNNLLKTKDGYYDLALAQQWNELFYIDQTYLLAVDHPVGTDAYMSMTSYLSDGSTGRVYTVTNQTTASPVSAINEKGQDVLAQLSSIDGVFTPGINGYDSTWNNITLNQLTLNLGNLTGASNVKLLIRGIVDWGLADSYYKWIDSFKAAAAQGQITDNTEIMPAPYLEVKAANGTWLRVNQDVPLPADYRARTYTVDITGIFPQDVTDYQIRFNNFWNVTYDYIGIDTSSQADITTQVLSPSSAILSQFWDTTSKSTGAFTRYGDVLPLVQNADDMFVVGRQGDQVNLLFPAANLTDPAPGMVRDYFFVVASWFKDPPGEWGYGFTFTVDPMPFQAMSGFPYTTDESYPYDPAHLAYIAQYNTRIIN